MLEACWGGCQSAVGVGTADWALSGDSAVSIVRFDSAVHMTVISDLARKSSREQTRAALQAAIPVT